MIKKDRLYFLTRLLTLGATALFCAAAAADTPDISVTVQANRQHIYEGESFHLTVKVTGTDKALSPDLSEIENCKIEYLGAKSGQFSFSFSGKGTRTEISRSYIYKLTPTLTGSFSAGPITIDFNGQNIKKDGPVIQITGTEAQDLVYLKIEASDESVLIVDSFTVTLKIGIKKLPPPYSANQPISPDNPPALKIPYLEGDTLDGLKKPDIEQMLNKLLTSGNEPGFTINGYELQGLPDLFNFGFFDDPFRPAKAGFALDRKTVKKDNHEYFEYSLPLTYKPEEYGLYTFGPVTFKGPVITGASSSRRAVTRQILAVGSAATVRVVPPPEENRPASFTGAIGSQMNIDTSIDSQTCKVGDPLQLSIDITGNIILDHVYPPDLNALPEIVRNFRVYTDTVKTVSEPDMKRFTYTVRPIKEGNLEIPPIEVSYYDVMDRAYKTVKSQPLPVRAKATGQLSTNIVISLSDTQSFTDNQAAKTPAPITLDPRGIIEQNLVGGHWQIYLIICPPLLFFCVIITGKVKKNIAAAKKKKLCTSASKRAINILREKFAKDSLPHNAKAEAIANALSGYVLNRFDIPRPSLTPEEAVQILVKAGIPDDLVQTFKQLGIRNFDRAYSPSPEQIEKVEADFKEAEQVIMKIEHYILKHNTGKS